MKKIRHPKILLFMGICITDDFYYIITEYMAKKSLDVILRDPNINFDISQIFNIAVDIGIL